MPGTGPRSDLNTMPETVPEGAASWPVRALLALTPREQFDSLDLALDRADHAESGILGRFGQATRTISDRIRTAITGLGLSLPAARVVVAAPSPRSPSFDDGVRSLEAGLDDLRRWRLVWGGGAAAPTHRRARAGADEQFRHPQGPVHRGRHPACGHGFPRSRRHRRAGDRSRQGDHREVTGGYGNLVEVDHGHAW